MLLRLRWDDKDHKARRKLAAIVGRIWDALEGVDLTEKPPLSSALWLDDAFGDDSAVAPPSKPLDGRVGQEAAEQEGEGHEAVGVA